MQEKMRDKMRENILQHKAQRMIALSLAILLVGLGGCASEEKTDEAGAAAGETIVYAGGFFDQERDGANSWRWMEPEGVIKLKNTGRDMTLKISGRAPVEQFRRAPKIRITLNGATLEELTGTAEMLTKEYPITPTQQGGGAWSELRIYCDGFFIPKDVYKGSNDTRHLAFSLTGLSWEPK